MNVGLNDCIRGPWDVRTKNRMMIFTLIFWFLFLFFFLFEGGRARRRV